MFKNCEHRYFENEVKIYRIYVEISVKIPEGSALYHEKF